MSRRRRRPPDPAATAAWRIPALPDETGAEPAGAPGAKDEAVEPAPRPDEPKPVPLPDEAEDAPARAGEPAEGEAETGDRAAEGRRERPARRRASRSEMVASIGAVAAPAQGASYYEKDGYYAKDDP